MLTAQVETLREGLEELKPLLPVHWKKLALNQDFVPLDPQYEIYLNRESAGQVVYVTLRDMGRLVGYWVAFLAPGLHYKTCLTGIMDIWNVLPEYENGRAALILMRAVEKEYLRRGANRLFAGEKLHKPCGRLFEAFGYEKCEMTYTKWLG